ncbi:MAG: hypothetical protein OZ934_07985 [Anaerolineae bacterium]|nr:hypothetical protein [Anaerolineae bacterium]
MADESYSVTGSAPPSSRAYRLMLAGTVLLFLGMLTAAMLVILLANAQEASRESDFAATLTALAPGMYFVQSDFAPSPEPGTALVSGEYPFVPSNDSPSFRPGDSCAEHVVTGSILDSGGQPTDALAVLAWGDYVAPRLLLTGEIAGHEAGHWQLAVAGGINRRVWVQLAGTGRYLSAPVEIVFSAGDCERTLASVIFEQRAALDSAAAP